MGKIKSITFLSILLFCTVFTYAQGTMTLDEAIFDAVDFFSSKLPPRSTVAVTAFEAETKELSDFIIQELMLNLANTGTLIVVERSKLAMVQDELDLNATDSVRERTAQRIGQWTGAGILFYGSITPYRDMYRMRVQAVRTETGEIIGTRTTNIKYDSTLTGYLGKINPADSWKYQSLYAGFSVGYTLQLNRDTSMDYYVDIPFGFSLFARYQPFELFGIALDLSGDLFDGPNISVVPTLTIRPSSFEVDLFLGVGYNLFYSAVSFTGGGRVGFKAGPGVLYAEVRPTGVLDLGNNDPASYVEAYIPINVNLTLGYQIGFIPRKK